MSHKTDGSLTSYEVNKVLPNSGITPADIRNISQFEKQAKDSDGNPRVSESGAEIVLQVRMLNTNRVVKTPKGSVVELTIVTTNDNSFYLQASKRLTREEREAGAEPNIKFVSELTNIQELFAQSTTSGKTDEEVKVELNNVMDM